MTDLKPTIKIEEQATASGTEIAAIIDLMEPALADKPIGHVVMACLSLCLIAQYPEITPEDLVKGVNQSSLWIRDYVRTIAGQPYFSANSPLPSESVN